MTSSRNADGGGEGATGRSNGIQGVIWKPEESGGTWIAFWQDPHTNQQHLRRFLVSEHGHERAKRMAIKCRRDADKQLAAAVLLPGAYGNSSSSSSSENSRANAAANAALSTLPRIPRSEVPGVYWYRNRNGWVAQWFENGKNKHKFFAASVFGVEGAKQKAIAYRLLKLEEKKLKGW